MDLDVGVWIHVGVRMKTEKEKQKALAMYIDNISLGKIAKEVGVSKTMVIKWRDKYMWRGIREKAIQEVAQKLPNIHAQIIENETKIIDKVQVQLIELLSNKELSPNQLINLFRGGIQKPAQVNINAQNIDLDKIIRMTRDGAGV